MRSKKFIFTPFIIIVLLALFTACDQFSPTPGQTLAATNTVATTKSGAATNTVGAPSKAATSPAKPAPVSTTTLPAATKPAAPAASPVLTATVGSGTTAVAKASSPPASPAATIAAGLTQPDIQESIYLDNRSTAQLLVASYLNAINRHEFLRAYSYWEPQAAKSQLGFFDQFARGYSDTLAVQLNIGTVGSSAGAGQFYSTVPVVLQAQTANGEIQNFVGCYVTHLGSPSAQATPPFQPLAFTMAKVDPVIGGANPVTLLATVCKAQGFPDSPPAPTPPAYSPGDISAARYLDDRSSPVNLLQTYYNAINRHEFLRAYSYWQSGAAQLAPFTQFEQGFKDTISATLTTGQVSQDVSAGQYRYRVPAVVRATTSNGPQVFAGCFQMHLASPSAQATPPFQSLAIESATLKQVPNNADTGAMIATLCQSQGAPAVPTPVPTAAPAPGAVDIDPSKYIDDRSTPQSLIMSLFNAINRREYVRAYSFWDAKGATTPLPGYPDFEKGYAQTELVQLFLGKIGSDAGAGQLYYSVPVGLKVKTNLGANQTFTGCYILHLSQPAIQGVPPFQPLAIRSATVQEVPNAADLQAQLATVCAAAGYPNISTGTPQPTPPATDISESRYLDNRSGALEIVRSFFNAINRHEYVRAYSYWQPVAAAAQLPPYPQFEQGYKDTKSVALTTGQVTSDAGAGQLRYRVPVTLKATTNDGATQTFVGCYQLHLSQPAIQGVPPFQPLAMESANLQQVANNANTGALMATACQSLP